jgi:hypothetical protein
MTKNGARVYQRLPNGVLTKEERRRRLTRSSNAPDKRTPGLPRDHEFRPVWFLGVAHRRELRQVASRFHALATLAAIDAFCATSRRTGRSRSSRTPVILRYVKVLPARRAGREWLVGMVCELVRLAPGRP